MSIHRTGNLGNQSMLRNEKGFTLIELLIVIAIIGILAAIAIPQFNAYKERAYDSDAKSHLYHMYMSCKAYWSDNGSAKACTHTVIIAAGSFYGYVSSPDMSIAVGGAEVAWSGTASSTNSVNSYTIDDSGTISP